MILRVLHLFLILLDYNEGCLYKTKEAPPQNKVNPGIWNDNNNERFTDNTCECGKHYHNETGDPRWNLFIGHSRIDPYLGKEVIEPVCVATIITSNLIATVLKCVLTSDNVTLNVYQAWLPDTYSSGLMKRSDIIVSTMSNGEGERFTVDEIIFGTVTLHQLFVHKEKNKDVHNDLLLLKLDVSRGELLGKTGLRLQPICVPQVNLLDFSSRLAKYYGAGEGQHPGNFSSDFHFGIVDSKRVCDVKEIEKDNSTEQFESICLRWTASNEMPPKLFRGGPLYFESVQDGTKFLAGVEYQTSFQYKTVEGKHYMFAYFTNILPMIKYIEHRANQKKSKWCRTGSLVLPKKIASEPKPEKANETDIPFEATELPPEVAKVEHHDIMNNKTKTDWGRFAEGSNILKEEIYKCSSNPDAGEDTILFYEKGNSEPFGKEVLPGGLSRRNYFSIKKEWIPKTDYVYATTCVIIMKNCDKELNFQWQDYEDEYPEENKVHRVVVNKGEKVNLEWFGLARRVTCYASCGVHSSYYSSPVIFLFGSNEDGFGREDICTCNNLNSSFGIPAEVINDKECLELYKGENCTGWIRTVPAGRSIHSENLTFKGSVKLPPTKSFSRCYVKPNCYEFDISVFKIVLKNRGVKDWNIQYKKYAAIQQTISHDSAEGETVQDFNYDFSVIIYPFKARLIKGITSRPNNGPYFELEDPNGIEIPNVARNNFKHIFKWAYENYIHKPSTEPEYVHNFTAVKFPSQTIRLKVKGFATFTYQEFIHKAEDVEFGYYAILSIHGRLHDGDSLTGDLLKEKVVKDLGYTKFEECTAPNDGDCKSDAVFVRQDEKFSMTITDGNTSPDGEEICKKDEEKCKSCNDCCDCSLYAKCSNGCSGL